MIIFNDAREENIKEHNLNWPQIPANYFSILIIGDSGSEKTNALLHLINYQPGCW